LDVFFRGFWAVSVRFGVGFGCFSSVFDVIFRPITCFPWVESASFLEWALGDFGVSAELFGGWLEEMGGSLLQEMTRSGL